MAPTATPVRSLSFRALRWAGVASLLAGASLSHAIDSITDPAGDFLPTFGGIASPGADLDVLSASVYYNTTTGFFTLTSLQAGPVGSTANGLYVWGVNRGAGVASFAANGIPGVRFDRVVLLLPNGTGTIGGVALPSGAVTVSGNTISATFAASLLPSTGFQPIDYTWNLWPRDTTYSGFAAISDFAPNNSSFTATLVPEPGTYALWAAGLAVVGFLRRRATSAA